MCKDVYIYWKILYTYIYILYICVCVRMEHNFHPTPPCPFWCHSPSPPYPLWLPHFYRPNWQRQHTATAAESARHRTIDVFSPKLKGQEGSTSLDRPSTPFRGNLKRSFWKVKTTWSHEHEGEFIQKSWYIMACDIMSISLGRLVVYTWIVEFPYLSYWSVLNCDVSDGCQFVPPKSPYDVKHFVDWWLIGEVNQPVYPK